jgi:hypothetical protein
MFEVALQALTGEVSDDAARIDALRALEELTCAAAARQAELTAAFDASRRAEEAARGVPAFKQGRGVASEIALARRESPHRGQQHLGLAKILTTEMPHTMAAFRSGRITEWRATIMVRETACLALPERRHVDEALARDARALERMGDREVVSAVRRLAAELDPGAVAARRRRAESERTVTLRPAPDTMTYLTALLPVTQGVAVLAALTREADSRRAAGDPRSKGQVMADTLVERLTGQTCAPDVPLTVNLVISDQALLGDAGNAYLPGFGPIPADLVRQSVSEAITVALRRLYASPATGQLVAMESRSRTFPVALAQFIEFRDQACATPWCDAPIRHTDHVVPHEEGGPTAVANGQGLCEACNHAKQARGWASATRAVTTPTGHHYLSHAPPAAPPRVWPSRTEIAFASLALAS